ncbi:MAG TPA: acyltransferase [Gemmataceae bacterium]|jgi:peptidoglycan/LPS O-acetylase OafA/YrhL
MRFSNLQLLRLLAATGVVVYHLAIYARLKFGVDNALLDLFTPRVWAALPVPLFFALSGFVLTHALHHNASRRQFLLARFLRLHPAYWLAALITAAVMAATSWPDSLGLATRIRWLGWSLRPHEFGSCLYVLGVEWSLVYEVFLSIALAAMSLFGLRRGLPTLMVLWLVLLAGKAWLFPGYASEPFPNWSAIGLSAFNAPFLLGVLAYYLRNRGRRWRWAILAGIVCVVAFLGNSARTLEEVWLLYGPAAAATVWLAVQLRQAPAGHPLVRGGDWTYGLYLAHVPIILGGFAFLSAAGIATGTLAGVAIVGVAALAGGLMFGWCEARLHSRLRPLARLPFGAAIASRMPAIRLPRGLRLRPRP